MMKKWLFALLLLPMLACEDLITLELNEAEAALVIVGEINNQDTAHEVRIHRTVPVSSSLPAEPVSSATVLVTDSAGRSYRFDETEPGLYRSRVFRGRIGMTYQLSVELDGSLYEAFSTMPGVVMIDSIGTASSSFMGEDNKYITLKFSDPAGVPNYYRYTLSVNESPFRYINVFDDKFNDGRAVTHELVDFDLTLESGDLVRVRRQYIDHANFLYWRSISSANPAASAPANPPSNISNGALGYFSAYSVNEYDIYVP